MQQQTQLGADMIHSPRIGAAEIPEIDWRPIRGSLGSFRAGYEEIEQFVSQLLDEVDAAWEQLEAERANSNCLAAKQELSLSQGTLAAIDPTHAADGNDSRAVAGLLLPAEADTAASHVGDAVVRRLTELEHQRISLQTEVGFLRGQLADQTDQIAEERRQAVAERTAWAEELRQLREAIHRQMEALDLLPAAVQSAAAGAPSSRPSNGTSHGPNDPVLGPLLAQFKVLQRDADRRRKSGNSAGGSSHSTQ